ncbi:hypothetical protein GKQ38_03900 [Candidatus Nanohaloarchaea archaeon]|nr:hypothetical protein GKQ38_03900 [Candidatus Nanohaloarchaea archaeon]
MDYTIEPSAENFREVRDTVEGILQTCSAVLSKDSDLKVNLSWGDSNSPNVFSEDEARINVSVGEGWKEELKQTVAQAYAQSWFLEYKSNSYHWEELLMLGHSLRFAENITEKQPELDPKDEVAENWPVLREEVQLSLVEETEEMSYYGFSLAYYLAEELEEVHGLKNFPELTMSDLLDAGDRIFRD